jgi:hypothetical protein
VEKVDPEDLQLMRDKYSLLSYYRVEKKLVTTDTSTFVLDSSFSFLITCYPNKIAFRDLKKQQRAYDARMRGTLGQSEQVLQRTLIWFIESSIE